MMQTNHVHGLILLSMLWVAACGQTTTTEESLAASTTSTPAAQRAQPSPLEQFQQNSAPVIERYMREHEIRKVQLGAGSSRLEGWLNTDIEPGDGLAYLDATKPFPFEDGSVHYIFSEHVIEHLTYDEGKMMIAESYRVLAPGGRMRVSTPDLDQFLALFDKNPSEEARAYIDGKLRWHSWPREPKSATIILNLQMSSWGHKFMYDFDTLAGALTRAGFRSPRAFEENVSPDPQLMNLEGRDSGVNIRWSNYETMSVEVEKPRTSSVTH